MWISGSRVFKSCAARKRFPAIELPSIVQRVGVPIRRGGAPEDCAARRALPGFKYPYSKRVGSPVGRAGSSVLRDRAARKRFPAIELPSIVQRVCVPIRRATRTRPEIVPRGDVFLPSSFRRSSSASAFRFGGAARPRPEIVPRGGAFPPSSFRRLSQRVGVPIRRAARTRPEIVSRGGRFPVSNVHIANEPALRVEGRLVCVPVICCYTCATGWPCRSSRRCRRTCRCPCGWT